MASLTKGECIAGKQDWVEHRTSCQWESSRGARHCIIAVREKRGWGCRHSAPNLKAVDRKGSNLSEESACKCLQIIRYCISAVAQNYFTISLLAKWTSVQDLLNDTISIDFRASAERRRHNSHKLCPFVLLSSWCCYIAEYCNTAISQSTQRSLD